MIFFHISSYFFSFGYHGNLISRIFQARPMLARSQPMQRIAVQQRQLPQINLCTFTVFCVVVAFSFPIEW